MQCTFKDKLEMEITSIEKKLIDSVIRILKDGEGCLYIINTGHINSEPLIKNDFEKFSIFEEFYQKRMDILAKTDGACIIDQEGYLIAYGARINSTNSFEGYGTRHSAAYSASLAGNISILGSQENKKVRIFKEGKLVMQIDALEKDIEGKTDKAVNILESVGIGTIGTLGVGLIIPTGIALLPGVLIFASSHYLIKNLLKEVKWIK